MLWSPRGIGSDFQFLALHADRLTISPRVGSSMPVSKPFSDMGQGPGHFCF